MGPVIDFILSFFDSISNASEGFLSVVNNIGNFLEDLSSKLASFFS